MSDTGTETIAHTPDDITWPHEPGVDASSADYAAHYAANQDKYHKLLQPIVEGVLAKEADKEKQRQIEGIVRSKLAAYDADPNSDSRPVPDAFISTLMDIDNVAVDGLQPWESIGPVAKAYELSPEHTRSLAVAVHKDLLLMDIEGQLDNADYLLNGLETNLPLDDVQQQELRQVLTEWLSNGAIGEQDSPTVMYKKIQELTGKYGLDPDLPNIWRHKAAENFLSVNLDRYSQFGETSSYALQQQLEGLGLSVDEQRVAIQNTFLMFLRAGNGMSADMVKRTFHVAGDVDQDTLRQAGEDGVKAWAHNGDAYVSDLSDIQLLCKLTPEFFARPEVYTEIANGMGKKLGGLGDLDVFMEVIDDLHLPEMIYGLIDQAAVNYQPHSSNTLSFIGMLGDAVWQKMPGIYDKSVTALSEELYDEDIADYFVEKLDSFAAGQPWLEDYASKAVSHFSVALKFKQKMEQTPVWADKPWAEAVYDTAQKTYDNWTQSANNWAHPGYGGGQREIQDADPYADHEWQFGPEQVKVASALSKLLAGKPTDAALKNLGIEMGIESANGLTNTLENMKAVINNYVERIEERLYYPGMEDEFITHNVKGGFSSLPVVLRGLASRYIAQSINYDKPVVEEIQRLSLGLNGVMLEGLHAYEQVLEVDVPLYDKLYEEFDDLRENGRKPMEVYLGRDGVYAWIGRRAQDAARRRKAVAEGWSRSEILEIHPKYVVYPRFFRDSMSREAQREYLEQADISQDTDPIFYDTGYTGTIPEQMMRVMGFSQAEIEQRIKLLSASQDNRRVRGISENARGDIIEKIEYNAKLHNSAEGMVRDTTSGEIRPIAKQTSPREQFRFLMIQQAISRHYWYKERHGGKAADIRPPRTVAAA